MKIAVPVTSDNQVNGHFGHSESYSVFTISDSKEITEIKSVESPQGCGCKSDIASALSSDGVTVMLAAGIGDGAVNNLNINGIEVIRGCTGNAAEVVRLFISGLVEDSGSSCEHHGSHHGHHHAEHVHEHDHEHEHEHNCGHEDHHHHEAGLEHEHNCSHHHNHEHGHDELHNCGCN
jgi:predicted Fe-Mo cluster-binding NifX family protein